MGLGKQVERLWEEVVRGWVDLVSWAICEVRLENSGLGGRSDDYFLVPKQSIITLRNLRYPMPSVVAPIKLPFTVIASLPNYLFIH